MLQVLVRGGTVHVEEVPPPGLMPGAALVRVSHSLISSGTESGFVSEGGTAGYLLKKARDPLNLEKVKRKLATVGLKGTVDLVRSKLFQFQLPGYSTAGVVCEIAPDVPGIRIGDRVACAGAGYASHAEYNAVPHNLLTPVPDGVSFEEAAFVTLGAIAMQGVRRAAPEFGETVVVLGLGLLGQLAVQLCRQAGCHVIGCDPVASKQQLAASLGAGAVCAPDALEDVVAEETAGYGADAVVLCAASKNSAVTRQALEICRVRGRVAVVGAVGLDLPREPLYMKEIDFRLSCSYGPGRYQPAYEEKGLDYPFGHVRWTEGRNMQAFLRMIAEKRVDVLPLISLVKPVNEAPEAYKEILEDNGAIAALLTYGAVGEVQPVPGRRLALRTRTARSEIGVAVVGAGAFAQAYHLPNLQRFAGVSVEAIVARTGPTAKPVAERFGARYCSTELSDVLADERVHAVVIATRHHLHAQQCIAAARAGKHIFVEKPLALTIEDAESVCQAVEEAGVLLTVGFNRRFSPYALALRDALAKASGPRMLLYRCNAGALPPDHWTMDPEIGGGRIVGECVHFYDLCCWLAGDDPDAVRAERIATGNAGVRAEDNLSTVLRFPNGSTATIVYTALGHAGLGKERIEAFAGGGAAVLEDFRGLALHGLPGSSVKPGREDKGQFGLMQNFIAAIRGEAALEVTAAHGLRAIRIAREALASAQR